MTRTSRAKGPNGSCAMVAELGRDATWEAALAWRKKHNARCALDPKVVAAVRIAYVRDGISTADIAEHYKMSRTSVRDIVNGRGPSRHVPFPTLAEMLDAD